MKHGDGGKGDAQRPGKGYRDKYDLIDWPSKRKAPEAPAEETKEEEDDRRTA